MRYRKRQDANQTPIAQALIQAGYSVQDMSAAGAGFPDLVVGGVDRRDGLRKNWVMEVKIERGKLNPLQKEWHETWRGPVYVVRSVDEALAVVGAVS